MTSLQLWVYIPLWKKKWFLSIIRAYMQNRDKNKIMQPWQLLNVYREICWHLTDGFSFRFLLHFFSFYLLSLFCIQIIIFTKRMNVHVVHVYFQLWVMTTCTCRFRNYDFKQLQNRSICLECFVYQTKTTVDNT